MQLSSTASCRLTSRSKQSRLCISVPASFGVERPNRRRRHATTLVETAAVITVIGLLLGLITAVTIRIVRAESTTRNHAAELHARSQLADQFRTDIHSATVVVPQEAEGLQLQIDPETDRAIEYAVEPRQVRRTVKFDSQIISHDAFRLPHDVRVKFDTFRIHEATFARIRVEQEPSDRSLLECTAEVNRDRSLLLEGERIQP